jgi:hypothetical protein
MKNKFAILTLAVGLLVLTPSAPAQTFGGPQTITGTASAPLFVGGVINTNPVNMNFPSKTVTLTGISSTNETVIFSWGVQLVGTTNVILLGSLTNSFAGGTNGGTWTTNAPGGQFIANLVPYAQASIGNNTNGLQVP